MMVSLKCASMYGSGLQKYDIVVGEVVVKEGVNALALRHYITLCEFPGCSSHRGYGIFIQLCMSFALHVFVIPNLSLCYTFPSHHDHD